MAEIKRTKRGYPLNKNGKPIMNLPNGAIVKDLYQGQSFKHDGIYYFHDHQRGQKHVYLP